ncbi:MAG: SpoIIE family protein phosphatase [Bryobacterales bacterium]|nr:SpoIIE family protein phosphatase [Bryobacterales bacterium]
MPGLQLVIEQSGRAPRTHALTADSVSVGRSLENVLSFPDDPRLSRNHLVFRRRGELWTVCDLGSKNGTFVNNRRIAAEQPLAVGDVVTAGEFSMRLAAAGTEEPGRHVTFVPDDTHDRESRFSKTVVADLASLLEGATGKTENPEVLHKQIDALVRAGRELAGMRPLNELFDLILDLSVSAVSARRGVLMLLEEGVLVPKAAKGDNFRISKAVCDQVMEQRKSLLVKDTQFEQALQASHSIAAESVKSLIAVPLQTNNGVIGLIYLDTPHIIAPFSEDDLSLLTVMANVAAIRLEHARLAAVEQAERMMQRELEQAGEIQRALLPEATPRIAGLELAGFNEPCRTVGGDYYDFFPYPDGRLAVVLADVAGKGMPAALMMSSLHARSHLLLEEALSPSEFLTRLNRSMSGTCPSNRFITMAAALIDPATGAVQYASAGHHPAILVRANGTVELVGDSGLVLGVMKFASYEDHLVQLHDGDLLAFYSDGISEATAEGSDEEFGEDRICRVLSANAHLAAAKLIDVVLRGRAYFTREAPSFDDATIVLVRRAVSKDAGPRATLPGD